jgi:hypothetical protein
MIYGTFKASDSVIPAQAGWHESMDPGLRRDDEPTRDRAKRLLRKVRPWKAVLELPIARQWIRRNSGRSSDQG